MVNNEVINFSITICTVLFGTDESIKNIDFQNGFLVKRMSLIPSIDNLDKIFEVNATTLRRYYESARIDSDTLDVMCIFKQYNISFRREKAKDEFDNICDETLVFLDNKIRAIRLVHECSLRFKYLAVKMDSETKKYGDTDVSMSFNSIMPVGEAITTKTIRKFHFVSKNADKIGQIIFPLSNKILNDCHGYYDMSYHQENFIAITLLITCLEMLFLKSENAKKDRLAKRCATYICDDTICRMQCYNAILNEYKKRSDFVHDGNRALINNDDIIVLRDYVRRSLIKLINSSMNKDEMLYDIIRRVQLFDNWGGEQS